MTYSENDKIARLANSRRAHLDRKPDPDVKTKSDREFDELDDTGKLLVKMAVSLFDTGQYCLETADLEVIDRCKSIARHLGADNTGCTMKVDKGTQELV